MKLNKTITIISLSIGLLATVFLVWLIVDQAKLSTVIVFLFIIFLIYLSIYLASLRMIKDISKENDRKINIYRQKGFIIQDVDNATDILFNELDKLKKELEHKDSQLSFMTTFTHQGLMLIDQYKNIIYSNQVGDELLHFVETKSQSYVIKIRYADIKMQIDKTFDQNESITKEYLIGKKILSIKTIPTTSKGNINVLLVADDLSEKVNLQTTKKDFFNFAGHELKTPITVLKGYAELIYHQIVKDNEVLEVSKKMIEQSEYMASFVEDMLMLSRLETFKDAPLINIDLSKRLEQVIASLEGYALTKEVMIRSYIEAINIQADPVDIDKMFKNLIENGIKYNYENGTVDIRLERVSGRIRLTIMNTGPGIDLADQERVFERFYRVNHARNTPGTGLGLSIVKHIVNKYHGTIILDSQVGKYTQFTIEM